MSIEAQHLLQLTIERFTTTAAVQSAELIALTKATGEQADTLIDLTKKPVILTQWIMGLTVVLGVIAALQLVAMFLGKG